METQHNDSQQPQQQGSEPEAATERLAPRDRRGLLIAGALLLVTFGVSTVLAVRALKGEGRARTAAQQATKERDQARKAEAEIKNQLQQALTERKDAVEERKQARAAEKTAQDSRQVAKAALAFLQDNLLGAGQRKPWSLEPSKSPTLREAVDAAEPKVAETFADRPQVEASVREILGSTYLALGDAKQAVVQFKRALDLWQVELGPEDPATGECRNKLSMAYRLAGLPDEASRIIKQNPSSPSRAAALSVEGSALLAENKPLEAEVKLRECLAIRQKAQPNDWTTFDTRTMLGAALLAQKQYAEAERLLLSGYQGMKQRKAKIPLQQWGRLNKALTRLVRLYEAWDKEDEAAKWRKELEAAKPEKKP